MAKYMQAAVKVDAIQFTGDNFQEIFDWVGRWYGEDDGPGIWEDTIADSPALVVDSGDSNLWLTEGEWLVRDIGLGCGADFHMYKDDTFKQMFMLMPNKPKEPGS